MKMIKLIILLLFITQVLSAQSSFDIGNIYPIERSHSYVNFNVTYMGYANVRGRFSEFQGTIYYDDKNPNLTSVSFQISVESINTDHNFRDKDLKSDNWFDAEKYPTILFSSSSARIQDNHLEVTGNLTIKETTKTIILNMNPVVGPMEDIRGDDQVIFTGSYIVNRKDYGVAGDNWSRVVEGITGVSDEVEVEFSMLGKQINQKNFKNFLGREGSLANQFLEAFNEGGTSKINEMVKTKTTDDPLNPGVLNSVGYYILKSGDAKNALEIFQLNKDLNPDNANVYDSIGEAYANLKEYKNARENYIKALEMDPKNLNAKEILRLLP